MAQTVYYTAATLDGFIADEADSLDWLLNKRMDAGGPMDYDAFYATVGALCMGATTYEWIRGHPDAVGASWPYDKPTWVFTHRDLAPVTDAEIHVAAGDVQQVHAEMTRAAAGQDIWVVGGGGLAAQFADAGLLDRVLVSVAPVTLGSGRPVLPGRFTLTLTDVARNADFACLSYDVGDPKSISEQPGS